MSSSPWFQVATACGFLPAISAATLAAVAVTIDSIMRPVFGTPTGNGVGLDLPSRFDVCMAVRLGPKGLHCSTRFGMLPPYTTADHPRCG